MCSSLIILPISTITSLYHASGESDAETAVGTVPIVASVGKEPSGIARRGRFSSSIVTPSSFVIPTTAGSPFLTNSYKPSFLS